jgi:predicted Zn-dependent protease
MIVCCRRLDRRHGMRLLASAALAPLAACAQVGELGQSMVSPEQERALGAKAFADLREELPRSSNAAYQAELERVGGRIVGASGSAVPASEWDFVVFKSDQLNAFALPGGHVGAFDGMMRLVAGSDDELVAVVGHEVGHVLRRHSAQRLGTEQLSQLGVSLAATAAELGGYADARTAGTLLGAGTQYGLLLPFSRSQELEADRIGLELMARAGYDPEAAIAFWRKMQAQGSGKTPAFLSTHPSDAQRIARLEEMLPEVEAAARGSG